MFPYTKESLDVNDTEYRMLKEAYEKGGIAEILIKSNSYELSNHQICAEDIIRRLERNGFTSSYAPKRTAITQREFEEIVNEVFGSNRDVKSFQIFRRGVKAMIWSRSRKESWQAVFDLDDNGKITGECSYSSPYLGAGTPMFLSKELRSRIRSALYK